MKPISEHIHTHYAYTDFKAASLIIQNNFSKGAKYRDGTGKEYMYGVFWTQIINETATSFELMIHFPADLLETPSSSGNFMKLLPPSDTMTNDKEPLYDNGLVMDSFLNNNFYRPSSLKRIVNPKESGSFYVVGPSNGRIGDILRTDLVIKKQPLFYRLNDIEIQCGMFNLKDLVLHKWS